MVEHGWQQYYRGCRCAVCREGVRLRVAERRAAKRTLTPVPAPPAEDAGVPNETPAPNDAPGPVVAAVQAELATLGDLTGWQGLAAAAVAMAHILDHPGAVTTQPAACRQLMSLLDVLHKHADVPKRRLEAVAKMARSSRPVDLL
jgi:hypothetical protein